MESTRDLGQIELWQASLERSLARRGKPSRSSVELYRLQPERDLAAPDLFLESTAYWHARRLAAASRPVIPRPVVGLGGISALALLGATTLPSLLGGRGPRARQPVAVAAQAPLPTLIGNGERPTLNLPAAAAPRAPTAAKPAVVQRPEPAAQPVAQQETVTPTQKARLPASRPHAAPHPSSTASAPPPAEHLASTAKPAAHPSQQPAKPTATPPKSTAPTSTAPKPVAPKPVAPKPAAPKPRSTHKPPAPKPAPKHRPAPKPQPRPTATHVNPLADASVTPERIDQGVDYAGTGTLTSIGKGRVTYVATSGSGWPGAFIEYQLLDGRYAGRYVYYAEGVRPASGIYVGRVLQAGQPVAYLIPGWSTGIEIGWGAGIGSETLAAERGDWSPYDDAHNIPSPEGQSFSSFIASLGGPPGT